jgi:hypothetical protein
MERTGEGVVAQGHSQLSAFSPTIFQERPKNPEPDQTSGSVATTGLIVCATNLD